jgi:hypothetical protein
MGKRKFTYYRAWIERVNGGKMDVEDLESSCGIFSENNTDITIERKSNYYHEFETHEERVFYGRIVQTNEDEDFFRRDDEGNIRRLSEFFDEGGETGEVDYDITRVAVILDGKDFYIMVESGMRAPGMGVIGDFIEEVVTDCLPDDWSNDFKLKHKWLPNIDNEEKLRELLDEEVQKTNIRFKHRPEIPEDASPEDGLDKIMSDNYSLRVEYSFQRGGDSTPMTLRELLRKGLGLQEDVDILDILRQIEFEELMSMFKVEPLENEDMESDSVNLARIVKIDYLTLEERFDSFDENGQKMCETMKDEISQQLEE